MLRRPALLALLIVLAAPAAAPAAPGDLTFAEVERDATKLNGAKSIAVSPDGLDVYVASAGASSVTHLRHTPSGDLVLQGCFGEGTPGCTPSGVLSNAWRVALSPDGLDLYVLATVDDAVAHFDRDPATGVLTYADCIRQTSGLGCTATVPAGTNALGEPSGIAVTPDGDSVIVAARSSGALTRLSRTGGGALAFAQCLVKVAAGQCSGTADDGLANAVAVAIAPDGASVYTAAESGRFKAFDRDPASETLGEVDGCLGNANCAAFGGTWVAPIDITTSPDGRDVYTADYNADAVSVFRRTGGAFGFLSCIDEVADALCGGSAPSLDGAFEVEIPPDGAQAYVTSQYDDTLTVLNRDAGSGGLTARNCHGETGAECADIATPDVLNGARGVAVSPDGTRVYAASSESDAVAVFAREVPPPPATADPAPVDGGTPPASDPPPGPAGQPPATAAPAPLDLVAPLLSIAQRRLRLDRRGRVLVRISCPAEALGCRGSAALTPAAARPRAAATVRRPFVVPPGRAARVRFALGRRVLARVRRAGRLRARLAVTANDAAGNRASRPFTLRLLPPRRR
jgi:DNA-binding beta-propeller fold protein YncE